MFKDPVSMVARQCLAQAMDAPSQCTFVIGCLIAVYDALGNQSINVSLHLREQRTRRGGIVS